MFFSYETLLFVSENNNLLNQSNLAWHSRDTMYIINNNICFTSPLQDKFVALLRLLLLWDPNARGGATDEHKNRECFSVLTKLINCKVSSL